MRTWIAAVLLCTIMIFPSCKKAPANLPDALFDVTIKDAASGRVVAHYLSSTMSGCSGLFQPGNTSSTPNYIALAGGSYNGNQFSMNLSIAQGAKGVFTVESVNVDNSTAIITMNSYEAAQDGGDGFLYAQNNNSGTVTISQFGISGSVVAGSISATLTQLLSNPNGPVSKTYTVTGTFSIPRL